MILYDLAARRYAAVRDMVEEMNGGKSPYDSECGLPLWAALPEGAPHSAASSFGRYRYLFKPVGDAVREALEDVGQPIDISNLVKLLREGGLSTDARAVNASLLNMKGILRTPTGHYSLEPPKDELPL